MAYFELTEETMEALGTTVHRIRATEDIEGAHVKKGELGGFACKKTTLTGKSWISGEGLVIHSHLSGDVKVMNHAVVEKSRLSGDCHIQNNAHLNNIDGGNIYAAGDCIIENTRMIPNPFDKFGYLIQDEAVVRRSRFEYTGKEKGKVIKVAGSSSVIKTEITGSNIQIDKNSDVNSSRIKGADILLEDVKEMKTSHIEGADIQMTGVKRFNKSHVNGLDVKFKGNVQVKDTKIHANHCKFHGMDVRISDSQIEGEKIEIADYAEIAHVDIMGDRVEIINQATLFGLRHDRILLGSNLKIQDCASFLIDEDGSSANLHNAVIGGEFTYTGL